MDETLCFVRCINALTRSPEGSARCCSSGCVPVLLAPCSPSALQTAAGTSMGMRIWGAPGPRPPWCQGRSSFPGSAPLPALATRADQGGYLFSGGHHAREPLLRVRHMLKWFPESGSWSPNWKRQVEVPLPPVCLSRGRQWNGDVKLLGL